MFVFPITDFKFLLCAEVLITSSGEQVRLAPGVQGLTCTAGDYILLVLLETSMAVSSLPSALGLNVGFLIQRPFPSNLTETVSLTTPSPPHHALYCLPFFIFL